MDYLKRHLTDYEDATQKEPKAKRALIHTLYEVLSVADIVEKEVKDKATFDALFEKSVTGKTKFTKALAELSEHLNVAKRDMDVVRNDRKKRKPAAAAAAVAATTGGAVAAPPSNVIVVAQTNDEDPTTTSAAMKRPAVAPPKKARRKEKITLAMREQIWEKYIGDKAKAKCPVCQTIDIKMSGFSAGHIIPESKGGDTNITNLIPICSTCNCRMSTMDLFEYTLKNFMRAPVFPGMDAVGEGKVKKGEGKRGGGGI